MITLSIQSDLFNSFPELTVGGFMVTDLDAAAMTMTHETLDKAWASAREELRRRDVTNENIANLSLVNDWRAAFAVCGVKPSTFKSSVEALARRTLKDGSVKTPMPVVTLYCAVSTRYLAPLGGYDLDRLPARTMILRAARPQTDTFDPLGARAADMPLDTRIAVYATGDVISCFLFNHRDSKQTCLTPTTSRALFVGEAVTAEHFDALRNALDALREYLQAHGANPGLIRYVSKAHADAVLELPATPWDEVV